MENKISSFLYPDKSLSFIGETTQKLISSPKVLNGLELSDIYEQRNDDFIEPSILEIQFVDADILNKEIVFVNNLYEYDKPRMLVSLKAVQAMHQAIRVLSRKVDNLSGTMRHLRESYIKEIHHLRSRAGVGSKPQRPTSPIPSQSSPLSPSTEIRRSSITDITFFNPELFLDPMTTEIMKQKIQEATEKMQKELLQMTTENASLKHRVDELLDLTNEGQGNGSDDNPHLKLRVVNQFFTVNEIIKMLFRLQQPQNYSTWMRSALSALVDLNQSNDNQLINFKEFFNSLEASNKIGANTKDNEPESDPSTQDALLSMVISNLKAHLSQVTMERDDLATKLKDSIANKVQQQQPTVTQKIRGIPKEIQTHESRIIRDTVWTREVSQQTLDIGLPKPSDCDPFHVGVLIEQKQKFQIEVGRLQRLADSKERELNARISSIQADSDTISVSSRNNSHEIRTRSVGANTIVSADPNVLGITMRPVNRMSELCIYTGAQSNSNHSNNKLDENGHSIDRMSKFAFTSAGYHSDSEDILELLRREVLDAFKAILDESGSVSSDHHNGKHTETEDVHAAREKFSQRALNRMKRIKEEAENAERNRMIALGIFDENQHTIIRETPLITPPSNSLPLVPNTPSPTKSIDLGGLSETSRSESPLLNRLLQQHARTAQSNPTGADDIESLNSLVNKSAGSMSLSTDLLTSVANQNNNFDDMSPKSGYGGKLFLQDHDEHNNITSPPVSPLSNIQRDILLSEESDDENLDPLLLKKSGQSLRDSIMTNHRAREYKARKKMLMDAKNQVSMGLGMNKVENSEYFLKEKRETRIDSVSIARRALHNQPPRNVVNKRYTFSKQQNGGDSNKNSRENKSASHDDSNTGILARRNSIFSSSGSNNKNDQTENQRLSASSIASKTASISKQLGLPLPSEFASNKPKDSTSPSGRKSGSQSPANRYFNKQNSSSQVMNNSKNYNDSPNAKKRGSISILEDLSVDFAGNVELKRVLALKNACDMRESLLESKAKSFNEKMTLQTIKLAELSARLDDERKEVEFEKRKLEEERKLLALEAAGIPVQAYQEKTQVSDGGKSVRINDSLTTSTELKTHDSHEKSPVETVVSIKNSTASQHKLSIIHEGDEEDEANSFIRYDAATLRHSDNNSYPISVHNITPIRHSFEAFSQGHQLYPAPSPANSSSSTIMQNLSGPTSSSVAATPANSFPSTNTQTLVVAKQLAGEASKALVERDNAINLLSQQNIIFEKEQSLIRRMSELLQIFRVQTTETHGDQDKLDADCSSMQNVSNLNLNQIDGDDQDLLSGTSENDDVIGDMDDNKEPERDPNNLLSFDSERLSPSGIVRSVSDFGGKERKKKKASILNINLIDNVLKDANMILNDMEYLYSRVKLNTKSNMDTNGGDDDALKASETLIVSLGASIERQLTDLLSNSSKNTMNFSSSPNSHNPTAKNKVNQNFSLANVHDDAKTESTLLSSSRIKTHLPINDVTSDTDVFFPSKFSFRPDFDQAAQNLVHASPVNILPIKLPGISNTKVYTNESVKSTSNPRHSATPCSDSAVKKQSDLQKALCNMKLPPPVPTSLNLLPNGLMKSSDPIVDAVASLHRISDTQGQYGLGTLSSLLSTHNSNNSVKSRGVNHFNYNSRPTTMPLQVNNASAGINTLINPNILSQLKQTMPQDNSCTTLTPSTPPFVFNPRLSASLPSSAPSSRPFNEGHFPHTSNELAPIGNIKVQPAFSPRDSVALTNRDITHALEHSAMTNSQLRTFGSKQNGNTTYSHGSMEMPTTAALLNIQPRNFTSWANRDANYNTDFDAKLASESVFSATESALIATSPRHHSPSNQSPTLLASHMSSRAPLMAREMLFSPLRVPENLFDGSLTEIITSIQNRKIYSIKVARLQAREAALVNRMRASNWWKQLVEMKRKHRHNNITPTRFIPSPKIVSSPNSPINRQIVCRVLSDSSVLHINRHAHPLAPILPIVKRVSDGLPILSESSSMNDLSHSKRLSKAHGSFVDVVPRIDPSALMIDFTPAVPQKYLQKLSSTPLSKDNAEPTSDIIFSKLSSKVPDADEKKSLGFSVPSFPEMNQMEAATSTKNDISIRDKETHIREVQKSLGIRTDEPQNTSAKWETSSKRFNAQTQETNSLSISPKHNTASHAASPVQTPLANGFTQIEQNKHIESHSKVDFYPSTPPSAPNPVPPMSRQGKQTYIRRKQFF